MKRYLPFIIVTAVALLALVSTTLLYRAKRPPPLTIPTGSAASETTESGHVRGNPDAPVTLEEFGDYECPPCGALAEPVNQMERDFRPRLRVIFYNSPSDIHPHAHEAAYAAEAAALQGRFWEMHDLLYREQHTWSNAEDVRKLFYGYAARLGMDVDRFKADMESEKVKARIEVDKQKAVDSHMTNTPQFFINGHALPRILYVKELREAVEDLLTIAR